MQLTNNVKEKIINSLTIDDFYSQINSDFINYYNTPGEYINFYYFCLDNNIDFKNTNIENFLKFIINDFSYKKSNYIKDNLNSYLEYFFVKKIHQTRSKDKIYDLYKYFIKKIDNVKKYNLDFESLLLEFNTKLLNE